MLVATLAKEEKDRQYEIMLADKARVDRILAEQKAREEERAIAAKAHRDSWILLELHRPRCSGRVRNLWADTG